MLNKKLLPKHIAIIMDGNGRWAKKQNKKRTFGHKKGVEVIKNITNEANKLNIKYLSLFAFSTENWKRPKQEVNYLMRLLENNLNNKLIKSLNEQNIRFRWIGFKNHLKNSLIKKFTIVEKSTSNNKGLSLCIYFNYGGMQDIYQASKYSNKDLNDLEKHLLTKDIPPVDLLIRTGNEKRISNFLIWQSAYAEIVFDKTYWPAYTGQRFINNLIDYTKRDRRFGKIY
ncbi:MAG: di-trans,poly-cis-decaprenylcistransferase [Mycoplasmataceae bacterium]|nr:di-trans,poly-cis-decaprenylcistransferase [Mycoplasmataceae bacterium]